MMGISKEITDAIEKILPQAVGEQLQQRLRQADEDAEGLRKAKLLSESQKQEIQSLSTRLASANSQLGKHDELAKREAAVAEGERNLKVLQLDVQLRASQDNTAFARDLLKGLVRNVEYRSNVYGSQSNRQMVVPQGGYVSGGNTETTSTNTSTVAD